MQLQVLRLSHELDVLQGVVQHIVGRLVWTMMDIPARPIQDHAKIILRQLLVEVLPFCIDLDFGVCSTVGEWQLLFISILRCPAAEVCLAILIDFQRLRYPPANHWIGITSPAFQLHCAGATNLNLREVGLNSWCLVMFVLFIGLQLCTPASGPESWCLGPA